MNSSQINVDWIVQEVVRRLQLREGSAPMPSGNSVSIADRVISVQTLRQQLADAQQLRVLPSAIVTPAAQDELRDRGVQLVRCATLSDAAQPQTARLLLGSSWCPPDRVLAAVGNAGAYQVCQLANASEQALADQLGRKLRPEDKALLFAQHPTAAVYHANQQNELRAAWGVDQPAVVDALQTIAANVLVLGPTLSPATTAIVQTFLRREPSCA